MLNINVIFVFIIFTLYRIQMFKSMRRNFNSGIIFAQISWQFQLLWQIVSCLLTVTSSYLVVTSGYLVVTSGYVWLLPVTSGSSF